jgi:hypothetical protein
MILIYFHMRFIIKILLFKAVHRQLNSILHPRNDNILYPTLVFLEVEPYISLILSFRKSLEYYNFQVFYPIVPLYQIMNRVQTFSYF